MLSRKIHHEVNQRLDSLDRHRIVNGGAHPAGNPVALDLNQAVFLGFDDKGVIERLITKTERDVHLGAERCFDVRRVKAAARFDRMV